MTMWSSDELETIDHAKELNIATRRPDGSARPAVPIWVVRVNDDIFVRSYRGQDSAWYRHASSGQSGRVAVAGIERETDFEPVDVEEVQALSTAIDRAYQTKYASYGDSYVKPMVAQAAQQATLRITPHDQ